jgi:CHAT domain-containing protein/Tfp pilus assembly protein FimT
MPTQRRLLIFLFLGTLTLSLWLFGHFALTIGPARLGHQAIAQSPKASQLVDQGVELYKKRDYSEAINHWQRALSVYQTQGNTLRDRKSTAIVLENLARATQQQGNSDQAIAYWQEAIAYYRDTQNRQKVGRLLTEQAQIYSSLGQPRKAISLICNIPQENVCLPESALQIARDLGDRLGEAAALGSLGDAHRLRGDYQQARDYLQASLKIAQAIKHPAYISAAFNGLGHIYASLARDRDRLTKSAAIQGDTIKAEGLKQETLKFNSQALKYFQKDLQLARSQNDRLAQMRSQVNSISAYYRLGNDTKAEQARKEALSLFATFPVSREKVYTAIDLSKLLQPVPPFEETAAVSPCVKSEIQSPEIELLQQAVSMARQINDNPSQSLALGELGRAYECRQDYKQALELTLEARWSAEQNLNADNLYLWEWQTGRILKATNRNQEAIDLYERAIASLESVRSNILVASRNLQFDFRDTVDPIYRQLIALKLEQTLPNQAQQENLTSVLATTDRLQLAELQNYFGDDCTITAINQELLTDLTSVGNDTAVISSIILANRTGLVVNFPNGQKLFKWVDVDSQTLRQEINQFRIGLESYFDPYDFQQGQKIYNWFIRPFAKDLERTQIKTLVFIQDGILRSIPMAALHDGKQFLIEKYAIATTPSLTLTEPKAFDRQKLRALILGLTKTASINGRRFAALASVKQEVRAIETLIPDSQELLDAQFTRSRLEQVLNENVYSIVHIATHGEFGSVPQDTFLVTGDNQKLTINKLESLIRSTVRSTEQIELLMLTACQTAVGDERAALGLAGVAVQAGARSSLASLWNINDEATAQVSTLFYKNLTQTNVNKAEALRKAQLALIKKGGKYNHPAYWAPYILVGNWL